MACKKRLSREQEIELVFRYKAGEPIVDLCSTFDRSGEGVRAVLRRHGVRPSRKPETIAPERKLRAAAMYEGGLTVHQVAGVMGLSNTGAFKAMKSVGTQMRPNPKRRLLTSERSAQLAIDYKAGGTHESLGTKYGVSNSVIVRVLREHGITPRVGWASYRNVKYTDRHGQTHSFKSTWEAAAAKWLDGQKLDWRYEPASFSLKVCRRYTPDFGIYEDGVIAYFVEVKGWVTKAVEKRMLEFRWTYPTVRVVIVGPAELARLGLVESKYANHPQAARVVGLREMLADA